MFGQHSKSYAKETEFSLSIPLLSVHCGASCVWLPFFTWKFMHLLTLASHEKRTSEAETLEWMKCKAAFDSLPIQSHPKEFDRLVGIYAKCCQLSAYADFHGLKSILRGPLSRANMRDFANEHWLAHNQNFTNYENLPKNLLNTISATMDVPSPPLLPQVPVPLPRPQTRPSNKQRWRQVRN